MTPSATIRAIDRLLNQTPAHVRAWERTAFDRAVGQRATRLVLFGAGNLGRKTLAGLRAEGIEPLAFSDNNPGLWNRTVDGLDVLAPKDAIERFASKAAFVVTIWRAQATDRMGQRIAHLKSLGAKKVVPFLPLFWKYARRFLPHLILDLPSKTLASRPQLTRLSRLWADEHSREVFLGQLRWRLRGEFDALAAPVRPQYFPPDILSIAPDESFVDCGAYDGDTIKSFLTTSHGRFGHIAAMEPDAANYRKLRTYIKSLPVTYRDRVEAHPWAVGSRRRMISFDATGGVGSRIHASGAVKVQCVRLDAALAGHRASFIKMDIEGYEPDALAGARREIQQNRPILAICVYHKTDHLWTIPAWIYQVYPNCLLYVREHELDGYDCVCYAVPVERARRTTGRKR